MGRLPVAAGACGVGDRAGGGLLLRARAACGGGRGLAWLAWSAPPEKTTTSFESTSSVRSAMAIASWSALGPAQARRRVSAAAGVRERSRLRCGRPPVPRLRG